MSEKLYQRQEDDMRKLQEALGRVDAAPEPKTEGTDLSGAEIEGLLLEKVGPNPNPNPNPNQP